MYLVVVGRGGNSEAARWCFFLSNCLAATTKSQRTAGRSRGEEIGCMRDMGEVGWEEGTVDSCYNEFQETSLKFHSSTNVPVSV